MTVRSGRYLRTPLTETFADLGMSPLSNAFINNERASSMEPTYPLHARVCSACRLVQLEEFESPQHMFGIGPELIAFTVGRSPHKQNTLLPGTRAEITEQMAAVRGWGGQFVVPIPSLQII